MQTSFRNLNCRNAKNFDEFRSLISICLERYTSRHSHATSVFLLIVRRLVAVRCGKWDEVTASLCCKPNRPKWQERRSILEVHKQNSPLWCEIPYTPAVCTDLLIDALHAASHRLDLELRGRCNDVCSLEIGKPGFKHSTPNEMTLEQFE